jgi:chromosomal replication initiation ATPase DnaA
MSTLTRKRRRARLRVARKGLVPERGIDAFAVGVEKQRATSCTASSTWPSDGEGSIKFLRGGYGCGKTFMARLAVLDAQARGFATSFVVVSDNDLRFHRFDDVYRKVVTELGTASCPRGALGDILDRWIGRIEEA